LICTVRKALQRTAIADLHLAGIPIPEGNHTSRTQLSERATHSLNGHRQVVGDITP
jgi:hypothetical protein